MILENTFQVFTQIHDLVYHGGGGFLHSEVYNMPIWMRRYHIQAMLNLEADFEDDGNQASGRNDKPDGKIIQTVMPSRTYETFDEEGNKNGTYTSFKSYAGALDIEKYKTIEEWKAPTIAQLEDIINWTETNLDKEEHKKTKMLLIKSCNTKISNPHV